MSKINFKATSSEHAGHVKVFINNILALSFDKTSMIGFQAYIGRTFYHIDLHFEGKTEPIFLEYDNRLKWEAMLIELGKIDL